MARIIGGTRSGLWWIGGLLCAVAFGGLARAGEMIRMGGKYGVRVKPAPDGAQKKRAEGLIAECLKPVEATEPGAEAGKQIKALIKDFGSADFKKRQAASTAIVKHGTAALGALRSAAGSADAEIAQRARAALSVIQGAGRHSALAGLRKMGRAGWTAVGQKRLEASKECAAANKALAAAEKSGDAAAIKKARAAQRAAAERMQAINRLYYTLRPQSGGKKYGVRVLAR